MAKAKSGKKQNTAKPKTKRTGNVARKTTQQTGNDRQKTKKSPISVKTKATKNIAEPKKKNSGQATKKNVSRSIPVGRTIKTEDKYLPSDPKRVRQLKDRRWVVVIDKNTNEELAVVRLTDEKQPNTTKLSSYKKGNKKDTYFKHFVEIEDNEGNAIRVDGKKFLENAKQYDLTVKEMKFLRDKVLNHSKQSQENRDKILILKNKNPRN